MREIKFRGKSIHTFSKEEWVYGYLVELVEKERLFIGQWKAIGGDATIKDELFQSYIPVDPETVGQYTGLKDKNGVEIYEGDIVELTNTYKGMNTKSIVEIDFIDFTFAGKWAEEYSPSGNMYNPLGSYNFPIVTIEVIGNKWDDSSLLGGKQDDS